MTTGPVNGGYDQIGGAWVHPGARVGKDVTLEPGVVVGDKVVVGDSCWLGAGAVVYGPTELGSKNEVHPGAVLGGSPQDIGYSGEDTRLVIGDGNVFREGVTIHRGTPKGGGVTRIGSHNYFMASCHVGHDTLVEDHVMLANDCLVAGHCEVHSHTNLMGGVAIVQFTTVGRYSFLGGLSGTNADVAPFIAYTGIPVRPRGINLIGLRRGGFSNKTIKCLKEAYRTLFDSDAWDEPEKIVPLLKEQNLFCDEVKELVEFMERSRRGKNGRMLQGGVNHADDAQSDASADDANGKAAGNGGGKGRNRKGGDEEEELVSFSGGYE